MKSLANKAVSAAYNKLGKINDLLNGPDPRFVSYRENGKDKKIENLDLNAEHCHSFIGKMKIDGTWTYSDDVITALLKYFFDHTKKWEKVVIELANKVSELLNGEESMEWNMKYEEQKEHILKLAKGLNKKRLNDLEIVDIENNNTRLFDVLKNEWIKWLDGYIWVPDFQKPFDSLDIAKYLYRIAKVNVIYLAEIKNLKSEEFRQINGDSDYYGLIEMAIRINALLHWVTLQWWVARQKKYDTLLLKHINPYVKDLPMLYDLQKNCREYLKWETFKWLYFDTKESELLVNKMDAKNQLLSKTKTALGVALGIGIGASAMLAWTNYIQTQKQKKASQNAINEIFESKKLPRNGDFQSWEYLWEEKTEQLNEYTQRIYDRFIFRFWSIWNFNEKEFKSKIIDCLNNQKLLDGFWTEWMYDAVALDDVIIDDYLIPQNITEFKISKAPTKPYEFLVPYTDNFIHTVLSDEDFEVKADSTEELFDSKRWFPLIEHPAVKEIGSFSSKMLTWKSWSRFFKSKLAIAEHNGKYYVVAGLAYVDEPEPPNKEVYSSDRARYLALDFLEQTNPILNLLLEQYLTRYQNLEGWPTNVDGPGKRWLSPDLELFLVREFLKQWLLEKLWGKITANNKQWKINLVNAFLDKLAVKKSGFLKKYNKEINPNLIPNGFFEAYEDAMENVIENADNLGRLPVMDFGKNQTVDHVWKYQTSLGKIYNVWFISIKGKRYLYADEEGSPNFGLTTYWPYEWEIVAIDYMKLNRPVVRELLDIFFCRYYGGVRSVDLQDNMEELLMEYAFREWLFKKLWKDFSENKQDEIKLLIDCVDNFVVKERGLFDHRNRYHGRELWNINMVPNFFLHWYENEMRNTIENKDNIYLSNYLSGSNRLFETIWRYLSSDRKKYFVWKVNILWKDYLCAEEEWSYTDDVLACGKIVAEDYFKRQN